MRWRFDGFSGVRASFHSGILSLIGLVQGVCAEQKTTASREPKIIKKRYMEMLWILVALGVSLVGLFMLLRFISSSRRIWP